MFDLQVPIQFWQHGVADLQLQYEVKAASVMDYACDEPTLPPCITLIVKGAESSEVTANMNFFREYNKLYYENFIYIAATHTFSLYGPPLSHSANQTAELTANQTAELTANHTAELTANLSAELTANLTVELTAFS